MPVFISYRAVDADLAKKVYDRLENTHGIDCFLDVLLVDDTPEQVTKDITVGLERCTHLLGIITESTRGSWWVPFEIGYATHCNRAIASFTELPDMHLPEYLWDWPILRGNGAIDVFAELYKAQNRYFDSFLIENKVKEPKTASTQFLDTLEGVFNPRAFHADLKSKLGQ